MLMKNLFLLSVFVFLSNVIFSQDTISFEFSYSKIERSKDSNRRDYNFSWKENQLTYKITERGRGAKNPISGTTQLKKDQLKELSDFIVKNFSEDLNKKMSVDSYVAIVSKGKIEMNDESYLIDVSCGSEDDPNERVVIDKFMRLLKSFISEEN